MIQGAPSILELCRTAKELLRKGNSYAAGNVIRDIEVQLGDAIGDLHAQVWYTRGTIYLEIGELYEALEAFQLICRYQDCYPGMAPVLLGPTHYHMALLYQSRREHLLALSHFIQAIELLRAEGYRELLVQALHGAARLCCEDGNPAGARPLLDEAETLIDTGSAYAYQTAYQAFVMVLEGDERLALMLLDQADSKLDYQDVSLAGGMGMGSYVAGLACLQIGLADAALRFAERTDFFAARAFDPLLMNLACSLRARALDSTSRTPDFDQAAGR